MGEWNAFCAVCSSTLREWRIGSENPRLRASRQAWVARRVYWRENKVKWYDSGDRRDDLKSERLRRMEISEEEEQYVREEATHDGGRPGPFCDDDGYDPLLCSEEQMRWLENVICVGSCDSVGDEEGFFFADVEYEDCGTAIIKNHDNDPDIPPHGSEACCYMGVLGIYHVFPIHRNCLDVLCRAIFGSANVDLIHKETLYGVLDRLTYSSSANLPYGDIEGPGQTWVSISGEEYAVTDPLDLDAFKVQVVMQELIKTASSAKSPSVPNLSSKVRSDPFNTLPAEIIGMIFEYLPIPLIAKAGIASWTLYTRSQFQAFWKQRMFSSMPWFWELPEILEAIGGEGLNYKQLYKYLDRETTPKYGMRNWRWLSLANRRRMWTACEIIAKQYHNRPNGVEAEDSEDDDEGSVRFWSPGEGDLALLDSI